LNSVFQRIRRRHAKWGVGPVGRTGGVTLVGAHVMNSAEGFFVNKVGKQEGAHAQAGSGEVPAMVGWILPFFEGHEKASDEGAFP
jgi:hypothetical protein